MANLTKEQKDAERARRPYRKATAQARAKFLRALARTGNVTASAEHAGLTARNVYRYAQKNARFANKMVDAKQAFTDSLESEAIRRGRDGYSEPIYQNGELVGYRQRYSDRLLETMLRANNPDKFGKQTVTIEGDENKPLALTAVPAKTTAIDVDALRTANSDSGKLALFED